MTAVAGGRQGFLARRHRNYLLFIVPALVVVGAHHDPFILRKSPAARNYLLSSADDVDDVARSLASTKS